MYQWILIHLLKNHFALYFDGFFKNIIPIAPFLNFDYQYNMDGPKNTKTFSIKCEQIPLNPTFRLTYYKRQGPNFYKLIVDLHIHVENMAFKYITYV
jgi:hypothetical protein